MKEGDVTTITIDGAAELEPVVRLTRDIARGARGLSRAEARYLVDAYYQMQAYRIQSQSQVRATAESGESNEVLRWMFEQMATLEQQIQRALDKWTDGLVEGRWLKSIHGIGPVIAAGLLAHIDIERAPTVGHIWRFAGLDPTVKWGKGQKRPWNARLKLVCWNLGDSFVKQRRSPKDVYGRFYEERKALELERNERGDYADIARQTLAERNIIDPATRRTYESGKLPLGRIELRARRYAVKLLLAHLHHVMYVLRYGTPPPKPYVLEHGGHAHMIAPPNWP
jgi:hypothetical protein